MYTVQYTTHTVSGLCYPIAIVLCQSLRSMGRKLCICILEGVRIPFAWCIHISITMIIGICIVTAQLASKQQQQASSMWCGVWSLAPILRLHAASTAQSQAVCLSLWAKSVWSPGHAPGAAHACSAKASRTKGMALWVWVSMQAMQSNPPCCPSKD